MDKHVVTGRDGAHGDIKDDSVRRNKINVQKQEENSLNRDVTHLTWCHVASV